MKVKVISGAPCSGKTTYVKERIGDNDIVYDYDAISMALKYGDIHEPDAGVRHNYVQAVRLALINCAKREKETTDVENFWIISTNPSDKFKKFIEDLDPEYVEMDADRNECISRLEKDETRPDKDEWKKRIEKYFNEDEEERGLEIMGDPKENIEKLIKEKGMQFRDFNISKFETRAADDGAEEMIVEGVAAVFNQETVLFEIDGVEYKEKIDPAAFDEADISDVIFNRDHCGRVYARTRNKSLSLWTEPDGLHMKASLWSDDPGHAELFRDIKRGNYDKMSYAYTVREDSYDCEKHLRTLMKVDKVYDVSAVGIPAYDTTSISARSVFDAERAEELAESEKRAKELELEKAKYFYEEVK